MNQSINQSINHIITPQTAHRTTSRTYIQWYRRLTRGGPRQNSAAPTTWHRVNQAVRQASPASLAGWAGRDSAHSWWASAPRLQPSADMAATPATPYVAATVPLRCHSNAAAQSTYRRWSISTQVIGRRSVEISPASPSLPASATNFLVYSANRNRHRSNGEDQRKTSAAMTLRHEAFRQTKLFNWQDALETTPGNNVTVTRLYNKMEQNELSPRHCHHHQLNF